MRCPNPSPTPKSLLRFSGYGFGYDPVGDDYKVVKICYAVKNEYNSQTLVYSLKQDSWNKIQDLHDVFGCGVYLNGSLYWAQKNSIISLNLSTEDYRILSLPPLSDDKVELSVLDGVIVKLSVLDAYLAASYRCSLQGITVWMMKGEEKWTKLFPGRGLPQLLSYNGYDLKPIAYWESKGELVNSFKGTIKQVIIPQLLTHKCCVQIWSGSLFHLDESVAAVNRKKDKRSKISTLKALVTSDSEDHFDLMEDAYDSDSDW